ncbi:MAG: hypothetical protein K2L83_04435, partial [Muribaculaceae bacterium]|nr:hypothetical protein [Muribaculaceae bacterium]
RSRTLSKFITDGFETVSTFALRMFAGGEPPTKQVFTIKINRFHMAEKKTFLFFCGWADALADLSSEDRCAVYDAVIAYANDGRLPALNPIALMAFKFIKKDIDEMQEKYKATCERNRENARKRWEKSNATACDGSVCMHSKHNHNHEHEHEHKHGQKEIKKIISSAAADNKSRKGATAAEAAADGFGLEDRIAELKKRPKWIEQLAKRFKISQAEIIRRLDEFRDDMELRGKVVNNPQSLFVTLLGDLKKSAKPDEPAEPNFGPGEYRNAKGERTYANGEVIVPESASPRPTQRSTPVSTARSTARNICGVSPTPRCRRWWRHMSRMAAIFSLFRRGECMQSEPEICSWRFRNQATLPIAYLITTVAMPAANRANCIRPWPPTHSISEWRPIIAQRPRPATPRGCRGLSTAVISACRASMSVVAIA